MSFLGFKMKTPPCDHVFQKSLRWSPFLYDRCFVFEPISRQAAFSEWTTRSFRKLVAWRCCPNSYMFDRLDKFMNSRLIAHTFSKNFPPSNFRQGVVPAYFQGKKWHNCSNILKLFLAPILSFLEEIFLPKRHSHKLLE